MSAQAAARGGAQAAKASSRLALLPAKSLDALKEDRPYDPTLSSASEV